MHVVDFPDVLIPTHLYKVVALPVGIYRLGKPWRVSSLERTPYKPRVLESFTQHSAAAATVKPCPNSLLHRSLGESLGGAGGRNLQARAPTDPRIAVPTRTDTNINRNHGQGDDTSLLRTFGARELPALDPVTAVRPPPSVHRAPGPWNGVAARRGRARSAVATASPLIMATTVRCVNGRFRPASSTLGAG